MSKAKYSQYRCLEKIKIGPYSFDVGDILTIGKVQTGNSGLKKDGSPIINKKTGKLIGNTLKFWFLFRIPNKKHSWYTISESIIFDPQRFLPL